MKTIKLTKGYFALVDDEDCDMLSALGKWHAMITDTGTIYAMCNIPGSPQRSVFMHRLILKCDSQVDHEDGDGLNNQRYNLRPANHSQNQANRGKSKGRYSSKYKGVRWHKIGRKWLAQIKVDGINKHLGSFREEYDAAQAYNFAAEEAWGEYARLNTPTSPAIQTPEVL